MSNQKLINYLKDKKILILGFGGEGKSTYNYIRKNIGNKKIYIADKNKIIDKVLENDKNVELIYGNNYLEGLDDYDIIMKSPGISFAGMNINSIKYKIKSELELLLEFTDAKIIGVTGTKGKSTTSSLLYKIIKDQGLNVMLMGNIGVPVFDYIDDIDENKYIVLEMSSHQLEYMEKSPYIAILLDIYEEHLDHYNSFNEYAKAKMNIVKYQTEKDYFIYNEDNNTINDLLNEIENINNKRYGVSYSGDNINNENHKNVSISDKYVTINEEKVYNVNDKRKLIGQHNLNNIMFALAVSDILKLDMTKTINSINTFEGLPHRLECVGKYKEIVFYNDTIATIPEATISSVNALKNVNTLIFGGMDRGINYDNFISFLNQGTIPNLICMPDTGFKIANKITNAEINLYKVNTLEEAVNIAFNVTEKNKTCLLSPAASSYGFFKNFEEKGEKYKKLIKNNNINGKD